MKKSKLIPIVAVSTVAAVATPLTTLVSCANNAQEQQSTLQIEVENPTNGVYKPVVDKLGIQLGAVALLDIAYANEDTNLELPFFMGTSQIIATDNKGAQLFKLIILRDFVFQRIDTESNRNDDSEGNGIRIIFKRQTIKKLIELKVFKLVVKMEQVQNLPIKFVGNGAGMTLPQGGFPTEIRRDQDFQIKKFGYESEFNHFQFRDGDEQLVVYPDEIVVDKPYADSKLVDLTIKKSLLKRIKNGLLCIDEPWSVNPYEAESDIDTRFLVELDDTSATNFELIQLDGSDNKGTYRNGFTGILKLKQGNPAGRAIQLAMMQAVKANGANQELLRGFDYSMTELTPDQILIHIEPEVIASKIQIKAEALAKAVEAQLSLIRKDLTNGQIKDLVHVSPYSTFEPGKDFKMLIWPTVKAMYLHHIVPVIGQEGLIRGYLNDNPIDAASISATTFLDNMALLVTVPANVTNVFEDNDKFTLLLTPQNFI